MWCLSLFFLTYIFLDSSQFVNKGVGFNIHCTFLIPLHNCYILVYFCRYVHVCINTFIHIYMQMSMYDI